MVTPLVYWHIHFPYENFTWNQFFIKTELIKILFPGCLFFYVLTFFLYVFYETKRTFRNGFNWPKNIAIFAAAFGWGLVSVLSHSPLLIYFTVVLAHDVSYTIFVWLIGRRDILLTKRPIKWISWFSPLGFLAYGILIVVISQIILLLHHRLVGHSYPNLIFGKLFSEIIFQEGWWNSFGIALFFSTQAHHYFIDRFLWKKEKDLDYLIRTGKFPLS